MHHSHQVLLGGINHVVVTIAEDNIFSKIDSVDEVSEQTLQLMIQLSLTEQNQLRDQQMQLYQKEIAKFSPAQHRTFLSELLKSSDGSDKCDLPRYRLTLRLLFEFIVRDRTAALIADSPRPFLGKALMSILQMFQRTGLTDAAGTSLTADLAAAILETPHSLRVLYKLTTTSSLLLTIQACQILILVFNNSSSCLIRESWRICIEPALFVAESRPALLPLARELALQMNSKGAERPYQAVASRILDDLESHSYGAIAHGVSWLASQRNFDIIVDSDVCHRFLRDLVEKAFHIPSDFSSPVVKAPASAMQALALFVWPPEPQRDAVSVEEGAKEKWRMRLAMLTNVAPDFVARAVSLFESALSEDTWRRFNEGHQKYSAELQPEAQSGGKDVPSLNKRLHRFALSTRSLLCPVCFVATLISHCRINYGDELYCVSCPV